MADANTAANSANSTLTTNFNVTPYYDDYDSTKQYYRLLFKPGYAVQARELTQIQSTLQSQIMRFGKHVFKEGSIVLPGAFEIQANLRERKGNPVSFVKIKNVDVANTVVNVSDFIGEKIVGATSNISAQVIEVLDSDGTTTNTKTLYIQYFDASQANSQQRVFIAGETLSSANAGTCIVLDTDPVANTGYGSRFKISEGVYFAKDHFISFPTQSIILSRYDANPTCRVGFFVNEEIINSSMDSSLLDPALESSNFAAPGSDRLKLVSQLAVVDYEYTNFPDFVTLFTIKDGVVQITNEATQYNILGDTMAKRTYDESGDYIVKGLNVQISEHDRITGTLPNYGRFANGNNSLLVVGVDSGFGYVKGYSIANLDKFEIDITKPMDYKNVATQIASTTQGQYITVDQFVGTWIADQGKRINFYDTVQKRITNEGVTKNQKWSTGSQTGNNIGSGIINAVEFVSGTPGYDAQYNIYLSDITMTGSNTFSNVRSLYYSQSPYSSMGADIAGASNTSTNTMIQSISQSPLLYYVGSNYTKSVRASDGSAATTYYFNKTSGIDTTISFGANGSYILAPTLGTSEIFPYGTTTLSDVDISQDITVTFNETVNVGPLWSGATVSATGNTLTGVGTKFTFLNIGDKIEIEGVASNTFYVTSITSNTVMVLSNTVPGTVTTSKIFKAYKTGDIVNLIGKGVDNGVKRTVTATPTALTFNLKETLPQDVDTTITYKIAKTSTAEAIKTLNPNRYVKIDCSTAGTAGPFCLGFSDVYQIRNIILKTGSAPTNLADGTEVKSYFTLDNGQRDTLYDLARIIKSPGLSLGATDYLLVHLDYFTPSYSGRGSYFSVNSYNIEDNDALASNASIRTENVPVYISPTTSLRYDLRNQIDFRPVKTITANDSTSPVSCFVNPSNTSTTYNFLASGMKFPVPSTELTYSYSYYMGRKDIVVVSKDGKISVTQGVASENPQNPDSLDTQMMLAILNITPYPSLSPAYANVLNRKDLGCSAKKVSIRGYTMRDIGVLDRRIKNLEYYTSLTLLEKDALNLKVLDDNGNDRFKNGIFIDTFKDTSLTAKGIDADFRIVTDPIELAIRPLFSTDSFHYDYISGTGVQNNNGKVTFDYTESLFFQQPRVTDVRNLERGTYYYQGSVTLFPNQDVWIDTSFAPDEVVDIKTDNSLISVAVSSTPDVAAKVTKSLINTDWEGWKATITGYNLYRGQGASKTLVGTYSTEAKAREEAARWTTAQNGGAATLETIYNNTRKGTNWFANESTDTAAGGNKLISSEIIPYIRPQELVVKASGLKPYSKMHVFFDSVNVDAYVTPLTSSQYPIALARQPLPLDSVAAQGGALIVDNNGDVYFIFKITKDGPKFRTGERRMIIMDSEQIDPQNPNDEQDASTIASAYFFADGTKQTLQRTVYSTEGYKKTSESTSEAYTSYADLVLPNTWTPPPPPKHGHCCFNPEAKVLMADLTWKAICEVEVGDKIVGDNGNINTVLGNNKVNVGDRKMMKFDGFDFYTTDDHLFLTKKGWKTWDPEHVLNDKKTSNKEFLIGDNRHQSIDSRDLLKIFKIVDNKLTDQFVTVEAKAHDFDPHFIVHDLNTNGNKTYIVEGFVAHNCCVAYTVLVKAPDDEEGIFVTSYDVFVARKSPTRGMWFEIREMDSAGNITDTTIPGSQVYYSADQILESANGKVNATNVQFDAPVFLFNNKPYAFVVHSFSPMNSQYPTVDPDTQMWISRLGETDKNTGQKITERQKMGNFLQTTNNKQWDIIPDVDLTINVYRAKFEKGTASFTMGVKPVEKFLLANVTNSLSGREGDHFVTGDTLTIAGANGTISVGDRLTGNVSLGAANGVVISIPSSGKYLMSNTRYKINDKIDVYYAGNNVYKGVTANVTAISNSSVVLSYYDETSANIYAELSDSTGGFTTGTVIQSVRESGYNYNAKVTDIKDYRYSAVSFEPNVLDFVKTNLNYEMDTYANASTTASGYVPIFPSQTYYFPEEKQIYCRTNEILNLSGTQSNKVRVTLESTSEYVSPVFDMNSSHTIFIDNLINANTVGEGANTTNAAMVVLEPAKSGGAALNKYISQTITLADGQDAEDLNVYLTAYRPPTTDVKVYVKLLNVDDSDSLSQKSWIELVKQGDGDITYSSISNRFNFKEFTYGLPSSLMTGSLGQVQYTSNGITFTGYKYFAVKIVLTATNSAVVPRVADLRCLALQI
ncbi:DUF4815 domain-containing protein [bacterium]|nr:DUF4815 domain-containing protein [bacterium]